MYIKKSTVLKIIDQRIDWLNSLKTYPDKPVSFAIKNLKGLKKDIE